MAREPEPSASIEELASMYRQLHRISEDQKALIENMAEAETFAERFGALVQEWSSVQCAVTRLEDRLRREMGTVAFNKGYEKEIVSLARQIRATMVQAEEKIKEGIVQTGASISNLQNFRHVRQAYADYEDHQAYFFDEKK